MPLIRCTRKLLTEMGARVDSPAEPSHTALLGDWYANLLWIDRRKCVIFTSERTLLTFLAVGVSRDAIRDHAALFQRGLRWLLMAEGFAPADVDRVLNDYQELTLAPTADRSVLGSLNELAGQAASQVELAGGLQACDLGDLHHEVNLTPMTRLKWASPLTATWAVLGGSERTGLSRRGRPSSRKKPPGRMKRDDVQIERKGDTAILTPRNPRLAITSFHVGPRLARMSDEEVLAMFNAMIDACEQRAAEKPYVAIEVPPGRPQIDYFPPADQWSPRGGVLRCVVFDNEYGEAVIEIDDQELSLEEFGRMLTTYAGWGMRIEFTPEDETDRRPRLEVRDPT